MAPEGTRPCGGSVTGRKAQRRRVQDHPRLPGPAGRASVGHSRVIFTESACCLRARCTGCCCPGSRRAGPARPGQAGAGSAGRGRRSPLVTARRLPLPLRVKAEEPAGRPAPRQARCPAGTLPGRYPAIASSHSVTPTLTAANTTRAATVHHQAELGRSQGRGPSCARRNRGSFTRHPLVTGRCWPRTRWYLPRGLIDGDPPQGQSPSGTDRHHELAALVGTAVAPALYPERSRR